MAWNHPDIWPDAWHEYWKAHCPEGRKHVRLVEEIAEARRLFDERQANGVGIFEAAENLPVPEMNRAGAGQSALRKIYEAA
jgi:hypothetical protein